MIDFTTFTSVRDLLTWPIGSALLLVLVLVLVRWRTGSMHVFWSRLWSLFISRHRVSDSPVEQFHDAQMDMLKFRFYTNIPVRTPRQVGPIIEWMQRHDQDAATIAGCGHFFDVAIPGLAPAAQRFKRGWVLIPFTLASIFFFATVAFAVGATLDRALLQFKATGHWFSLNAGHAKPLGDSPGFSLERCGVSPDVLSKESGFELQEIAIICTALRTEDVGAFVRKSVSDQRLAFAWVALLLLVITWRFGAWLRQIEVMLKLRRTLTDRASIEQAQGA